VPDLGLRYGSGVKQGSRNTRSLKKDKRREGAMLEEAIKLTSGKTKSASEV
jgi:hypothetical protein